MTLATTVVAAFGLMTAAAQAQIEWKPCGNSNEVACGHLNVPIDPSGAIPGTLTLALRRHRSPIGEAKDAVIALAGGPGQAAIPFVNDFVQLLGPILSTRDLITFDQRGTGLSHPLSCPAFEHIKQGLSPTAVAICGGQIGQTRGLFTTEDTVADIEAIRQAGDYEKLVLYGTSYGTKVAERYAQEHPSHVEALILDSVVPPNGPEAFDETTFAAVGRILRQLCSGRACAHITREPVEDLARLVRRLRRGPLRGRLIDGEGVAQPVRIFSNELLGALLGGDFDPILRSEFPAAVHSALLGDTAALARMLGRTEAEAQAEEEEGLSEAFDTPLYYSTICEETDFPWARFANSKVRLHEAVGALSKQPANAFAPFTNANAFALSDVPDCSDWPMTGAGPEVDDASLPDVPTLILSGADDLRTPTANARAVAAEIPDAHLLVVPNTGHSVLGSDPTSCAHNALQALFAGKPIEACKQRRPPALLLPTPLPPRSVRALQPVPGSKGSVGRTTEAALLTLGDLDRQVIVAELQQGGAGDLLALPSIRVGGLRAGWGATDAEGLVLHNYSYVPGVTISGHISSAGAELHLGGKAALHGTIRINAHGTLTGALGRAHIHLTAPKSLGTTAASLSLTAQLHFSALISSSHRRASLNGVSRMQLLHDMLTAGL